MRETDILRSRWARSGLRQWLLFLAPLSGAIAGVFLPWGEAMIWKGPDIRPTLIAFTADWKGIGAIVCAGVGIFLGVALVLINSLSTRRVLTFVSFLIAVTMFAMSLGFALLVHSSDARFQIKVGDASVRSGLGMGLLIACSASLAWGFTAIASLTWGRPLKPAER